ncbi:MAG: cytochrome c maturation protein CcmE [Phenylobacterium sp.]|uniref:cytochrome c maturation protein CcmE n=1 Tax=Phenylobacterium sp. TaxID=1871053 RepID=UPI0025D55463|nr:cytochrome c maturation protein CcmE [Phenylobacterium sp.]MBI1196410.1 cytochrome c maturation protein CcmE [Phenylobacterium sp.]
MSLLPKSRKARRRLTLLAVIAPIVALAAGLGLWGMRDSISFFYTPAQAAQAKPAPGKAIQLGGLVAEGSVVKHPDGQVEFTVRDKLAADRVVFQGDLPDLFREGQGIVAEGAYRADGVFVAKRVLAKHDEKYMPKEVADALKAQGEWRGDGEPPAYAETESGRTP